MIRHEFTGIARSFKTNGCISNCCWLLGIPATAVQIQRQFEMHTNKQLKASVKQKKPEKLICKYQNQWFTLYFKVLFI